MISLSFRAAWKLRSTAAERGTGAIGIDLGAFPWGLPLLSFTLVLPQLASGQGIRNAPRPAPRALRLMGQSLMEEKAEKYCQISQSAEL